MRSLLTNLAQGPTPSQSYYFDDNVTLKFYRLQKISDGSISLGGKPAETRGPRAVGTNQ